MTPDELLADLDPAQREAVTCTRGPLVVLAGAGSGKTRVISRRAAYAIASGAVDPSSILLVTFTDKAAREMEGRMAALGHRGVMARTFHAMALAQLRFFWPSRHGGEAPPDLLPSKGRLIVPLARRLPGHYRFTPSRDLAETIEWAKVRGIGPGRWVEDGGDRAPVPPDLFARLYREYEGAKARLRLLDFEDLLVETVRLLETDEEAADLVRSRKSWFSVDEYQDTSPLADRLVTLWLGDSRDICVVGDPDQTIYSFTGASPDHLLGFEARHPGARVVRILANYRSTPAIVALANRLTAGGPRGALVAVRPDGPVPVIRRHADADAELDAIVADVRTLLTSGRSASDIAVLVRTNAQIPPLEEAFTRAGLPYRASVRFFDRPDVREALRIVGRLDPSLSGRPLLATLAERFAQELGHGDEGFGSEARERDASLDLLLGIARGMVAGDTSTGPQELLADLERRARAEASNEGEGVDLLTIHRAKGLEWSAVFLSAVEEGLLPIRQAKEPSEIDEERRLLYVGITRARDHLVISWAADREQAGSRGSTRRPSRFLADLAPGPAAGVRRPVASPRSAAGAGTRRVRLPDAGAGLPVRKPDLLPALLTWRSRRAAADHVTPASILPDEVLAAIADARPTTTAALRRVRGMGQDRLERYGADLLAAVGAAPTPGLGGRQPGADAPGPGHEPGDAELLEALRAWRRERARADGVPAYVVAHDATLAAIAEARPTSPTELAGVKGMGPTRVERYGTEILAFMPDRDGP